MGLRNQKRRQAPGTESPEGESPGRPEGCGLLLPEAERHLGRTEGPGCRCPGLDLRPESSVRTEEGCLEPAKAPPFLRARCAGNRPPPTPREPSLWPALPQPMLSGVLTCPAQGDELEDGQEEGQLGAGMCLPGGGRWGSRARAVPQPLTTKFFAAGRP